MLSELYELIDAWTDDRDAVMDDAQVQIIDGTVQIYVPGGVVFLTLDEWHALAAWVTQQQEACPDKGGDSDE